MGTKASVRLCSGAGFNFGGGSGRIRGIKKLFGWVGMVGVWGEAKGRFVSSRNRKRHRGRGGERGRLGNAREEQATVRGLGRNGGHGSFGACYKCVIMSVSMETTAVDMREVVHKDGPLHRLARRLRRFRL